MQLHRLERADDLEVMKWLEEELDLTVYQRSKIREGELVRFSPFYFYKPVKHQTSFWWRLSLPFLIVYWLLLVIWYPFNFLITGSWGYSRNFTDKFVSPWLRRLGL